ncbi:phenylacetate--CoA ligase family protein [Desulfobulbus oligotrophicus]|uniref:Phenylacetate--CoA ligase family protein n=1 Tax=Desulfobulbus oligotrophicus TaxID=1909699 RepID=A0A7T6APH1_9BACT|nr:phenylacetate--CoA ligase family protein [Desulfobulbus oligotrophicus]QQG64701.1 phenylacetate--CoA ligase family protein [Desulfobulbus oligotrophicus]
MLMPFIRRNIVERLLALKNGSVKLECWQELEKSQWLPEEELRAIQWQCLQTLLNAAYTGNTFYRQRFEAAGITPDMISTPDDLRRLPILTKEEIRAAGPSMLSQGFEVENLQQAKTGGSTGRSLELYYTEECSERRNGCAWRHDRWAGWQPGEPVAACWGNPMLPKTVKEWLQHWLVQPILYLDTMSVNDDAVRSFVSQWHRMKPTLLFGHAHSLYLLACYLKKLNIIGLQPKGIISSSMMLIPSERQVIEETFGVRVIDRYGCEEVSLIACECERHEGMHLNIDHLFIEFIGEDGQPAAAGEPGKIVVTDLINTAMPFIRYQVEDVGIPTDRRCSCGRGLPLMEGLAGRVADFLVKPDQTRVAGISLIENTLTRFTGLDQMQIVQHALLDFEMRLVVGPTYTEEVGRELITYWKSVFSEDAQIRLVLLDAILPEQSGKFRFSICHVK